MRTYYIEHPKSITMRQQYGAAFVRFQQKSEEVVAEFSRAAAVHRHTAGAYPGHRGADLPNSGGNTSRVDGVRPQTGVVWGRWRAVDAIEVTVLPRIVVTIRRGRRGA